MLEPRFQPHLVNNTPYFPDCYTLYLPILHSLQEKIPVVANSADVYSRDSENSSYAPQHQAHLTIYRVVLFIAIRELIPSFYPYSFRGYPRLNDFLEWLFSLLIVSLIGIMPLGFTGCRGDRSIHSIPMVDHDLLCGELTIYCRQQFLIGSGIVNRFSKSTDDTIIRHLITHAESEKLFECSTIL